MNPTDILSGKNYDQNNFFFKLVSDYFSKANNVDQRLDSTLRAFYSYLC